VGEGKDLVRQGMTVQRILVTRKDHVYAETHVFSLKKGFSGEALLLGFFKIEWFFEMLFAVSIYCGQVVFSSSDSWL
jgi:hypothetical protein